MPNLLALLIAGAGIYAGYRWVSRWLDDKEAAARKRDASRRAAMARGGDGPKDLGTLEYDPASGTYRPRKD